MAARINSLRNGSSSLDEVSRDDLVSGDVVAVSSLDAATTYAWTLVFVPEGSAATFSGSASAVSPGSFTVDEPGAYLARLIVDAGLGTEDTQYVRLRALTTSLSLTLVAAGERRDSSGTIPVDVDTEGWANEQNANLLALEAAARPTPKPVSSAPYTVLGSDRILMADVGGAFNLPAIASFTGPDLKVKDRTGNASATPIVLTPNGAETIDGAASLSLGADWESVVLVPEGTEWSVF
jgi:hypothetical protein